MKFQEMYHTANQDFHPAVVFYNNSECWMWL